MIKIRLFAIAFVLVVIQISSDPSETPPHEKYADGPIVIGSAIVSCYSFEYLLMFVFLKIWKIKVP